MGMDNLEEILLGTRTALMVVDVQNDYCHPEGALAKGGADVSGIPAMVPHLRRILDAARRFGRQVIFVQTIHEDATDSELWKMRASGAMRNVCRPGTWGMQFYAVAPAPGEIVVHKHKYSGFINTRLDSVLRAKKIETLLIAGVSTNVCVESTARDAFMLDYRVLLLEDACASYNSAAHEMTLRNIADYFGSVVATDEVLRVWQGGVQQMLPLVARKASST